MLGHMIIIYCTWKYSDRFTNLMTFTMFGTSFMATECTCKIFSLYLEGHGAHSIDLSEAEFESHVRMPNSIYTGWAGYSPYIPPFSTSWAALYYSGPLVAPDNGPLGGPAVAFMPVARLRVAKLSACSIIYYMVYTYKYLLCF